MKTLFRTFFKEISNRLVNYHVIKKPTKVISDNSVAIKNYNLNTIKALKLAKMLMQIFL